MRRSRAPGELKFWKKLWWAAGEEWWFFFCCQSRSTAAAGNRSWTTPPCCSLLHMSMSSITFNSAVHWQARSTPVYINFISLSFMSLYEVTSSWNFNRLRFIKVFLRLIFQWTEKCSNESQRIWNGPCAFTKQYGLLEERVESRIDISIKTKQKWA